MCDEDRRTWDETLYQADVYHQGFLLELLPGADPCEYVTDSEGNHHPNLRNWNVLHQPESFADMLQRLSDESVKE